MDRNEIPHDPRHQCVLSGVSKMIFELMVCSVQTMHLSCTNTNTISKWIETRFHMTKVSEEIHRVHPKWFLSLWYDWRKPCTYLAPILTHLQTDWNEIPLNSRHLCVLSGVSKMIFGPMVHLAQNMHLSGTDTNTVSKWTEMRFHVTHVT
jgi:hypothetical protein